MANGDNDTENEEGSPPSPPPSSSSKSTSSSNSTSPSSAPQPSSPPPSSPPPASSPPPPSASPPPPSPPPKSPPAASPPPPSDGDSETKSPPTPTPPPSPKSSPTPTSPSNNKNPSAPVLSPPPSTTKKSSPPPPSLEFSPPPPKSSSSSSSSSSKSSKNDSSNSGQDYITYSVVGAVVVGLFLIAMLIICASRACGKKKKRRTQPMHYYGDQSNRFKKGDPYYNGAHNPNWHGYPQGPDYGNSKIPPPPASGNWGPPPPPPPMMTYSGEMMSSQFSGPVHPPPLPPPSPNIALGFNKSTFTYDELATATDGFAKSNLLGQGGFGYVHKGVLPPNGKEVAVKSLKTGSGQGEREFAAEVEIISRVHHRHLVSLVGYCIAGEQRMLVYEFVSNKTLEYHLHGENRPVMDFATRLRIALGSAKGLAYLHEDCHPRIIHRDIKAANILIDDNFEAMVADFGLAKLSNDTNTHVSTRVMGTFGYLAPEYASSGKLSEKSDVFSFGVMLLELITGKRPIDVSMEDSLVEWARPLMGTALEEGKYDELVDPRLEHNYVPHEMARLVASAAASIRHSARKRPKMSQIVRALEGDTSLDDLNDGVKPGQSSAFGMSNASTEYNAASYNNDMKKFRQLALSSQDFSSSDFGGSGDSREIPTPKQRI